MITKTTDVNLRMVESATADMANTGQPTPEAISVASSSASPYQSSQPSRRILACVLCQQKKVRCDRKFPCAHCRKAGSQCVPAGSLGPRQRKPRFPERALLDRIRQYEDLLRKHDVDFEPMHKEPAAHDNAGSSREAKDNAESDDEPTTLDTASTPHSAGVAKNFWDAMSQGIQTPEGQGVPSTGLVEQIVARQQWQGIYENGDHLFFGLRGPAVDLPSLHATPVQAFRLWQVYLDNVNPLLKVTHTPSLQPRFIEALVDVNTINPTLEALVFSIYCVALQSLTDDECMSLMKSPKGELLSKFQTGCQHALANSGYLRTNSLECLTALFLYLVSVGLDTDPRSLSSMLGVAMRIAQRMGIHNEAPLGKYPPFEIEMRRRLWWALSLYDTRIGMLADYKNLGLAPTWDCRHPLNVNDSELWPDMKELPNVTDPQKPSEAVFAVVRAVLNDAIRYADFHLDRSGAAFKGFAKKMLLSTLEQDVEDKYLKQCDSENPLHLITIWTARGFLARCKLIEYYAQYGAAGIHPTESQRDASMGHALALLESDTRMAASPRLGGYSWLLRMHFPLPGYIHITYELRTRPLDSKRADQAWEMMAVNCEARLRSLSDMNNPRFKSLAGLIMVTWDACAASHRAKHGEPPTPPRLVSRILAARAIQRDTDAAQEGGTGEGQREGAVAPAPEGWAVDSGDLLSTNGPSLTIPMGAEDSEFFQYGMDWQPGSTHIMDMFGDAQLNWAAMGWELGDRQQ